MESSGVHRPVERIMAAVIYSPNPRQSHLFK
jgi:hypothetical protein